MAVAAVQGRTNAGPGRFGLLPSRDTRTCLCIANGFAPGAGGDLIKVYEYRYRAPAV
jgi:hypothetical protein